ncbi:MAG TPA: outer membrane beta-barrel protein [Chryseosolibacter sp.]
MEQRPMGPSLKFHIILVSALCALNSVCCQGQGQSLESNDSVMARKRFVSNVEILVGSGMVFFRGDEFYKKYGAFKAGFSAHYGLVHKINSRLNLVSLLGYEIKGAKHVTNTFSQDYQPPARQKHIQSISINYATVTLLTKYYFPRNQKLFLGCGPYLGYLLREKITSKLYLNDSLASTSGVINYSPSNYKSYDWGFAATAGANISWARKRSTSIQLMYQKGMRDINQPMITQIRNRAISILVGLTII